MHIVVQRLQDPGVRVQSSHTLYTCGPTAAKLANLRRPSGISKSVTAGSRNSMQDVARLRAGRCRTLARDKAAARRCLVMLGDWADSPAHGLLRRSEGKKDQVRTNHSILGRPPFTHPSVPFLLSLSLSLSRARARARSRSRSLSV